MLSTRSLRHLSTRRSGFIWRTLTTSPVYCGKKSSRLSQEKRPAHVGPREWRKTLRERQIAEVEASITQESPETVSIQTRLLELLDIRPLDADSTEINAVLVHYEALLKTKDPIPLELSIELLKWLRSAHLRFFRELKNGRAGVPSEPQSKYEYDRLSTALNDLVAQYKQGRFVTNSVMPRLLLYHFDKIGEWDTAMKFWNWLLSMKEPGHMSFETYAARIRIADNMGEDLSVCEELLDEAVSKFGAPLTRYHISNNAILQDASKPAPPELAGADSMLDNIFRLRLKDSNWRDGYLTLDTVLRLHPENSMKSARSAISQSQSSWEAFLVQRHMAHEDHSSMVLERWLKDVLSTIQRPAKTERELDLIHSIAMTSLRLIVLRIASYANNIKLGQKPSNVDFWELDIFRDCWLNLNMVKRNIEQESTSAPVTHIDEAILKHFASILGKEDVEVFLDAHNGQSIRMQQASLGSYFMRSIPALVRIKSRGDFKRRLSDNMKLLKKIDFTYEPILQERAAWILSEINRFIIGYMQSPDDNCWKEMPIPNWSSLITEEEMRDLYEEIVLGDHVLAINEDHTSEETSGVAKRQPTLTSDSDMETQDLVYATQMGIPYEEARFRNWMLINEMFLIASKFEEMLCLNRQQPGDFTIDEFRRRMAREQAEGLIVLNGSVASADEREHRKQEMFDRLREFRRHRGDDTVV